MQKSKTETLIQKYLSHQLNEQEFKELKQWIEEDASHKEIFVKLLSLRHVNNQLNLLQQFDKEASWEAIQKTLQAAPLYPLSGCDLFICRCDSCYHRDCFHFIF